MTIDKRRWFAKKLARSAMAAAAEAPMKLALRGESVMRVLTYHRFATITRDPFAIPTREFDAQMKYVAEKGLGASLADLELFLRGERTLAADAVVITSDDGFRSVLTDMLPVVREHALPAVAFVTASLIRETDAIPSSLPDGQPEPYLSWTELGRLAESGITLGCHSHTHRSLGQMSVSEAREQASLAMERFRERLGMEVTAFAYPYGTRADFSDDTARVLRDTGYAFAFTSQHGAIEKGMDPFALPRIKVESGDPAWIFPRLVHGAMDAWRIIDSGLWRLQLSR